jgi:AcrR family transcriptional regulator
MARHETRERILDAAEVLFADLGISGTSMRRLTRHADVNLAAAHYHFGSKEGLLDAVIERRAGAINAQRSAALDALEAEGFSGDRSDRIRALLVAYFSPILDVARAFTNNAERESLARLMAQVEAQPRADVEALFRRHFGELSGRYVTALKHCVGEGLPAEDVTDRFRFAVAVLTQLLCGNLDLDMIPDHPPAASGDADRFEHAIAFAVAGFLAPIHRNSHAPSPLQVHDRSLK